MGRLFQVRVGRSVDIPVVGLPVPTVILKKNNANVSIGKYKLEKEILQFGPIEELDHGIYSITVSNCFNAANASFAVDVLSKCCPAMG